MPFATSGGIVMVEIAVTAPPFVVVGESNVVEKTEEICQPIDAEGVNFNRGHKKGKPV